MGTKVCQKLRNRIASEARIQESEYLVGILGLHNCIMLYLQNHILMIDRPVVEAYDKLINHLEAPFESHIPFFEGLGYFGLRALGF